MAAPASHLKAEKALRRFALAFGEAAVWGDRFIRVRGRIFASIRIVDDALQVGVKLPVSAEMALMLPYCKPSGRGLSRAGWITAHFVNDERLPVAMLKEWIDQSYRAIAPMRPAATLGARSSRDRKLRDPSGTRRVNRSGRSASAQ